MVCHFIRLGQGFPVYWYLEHIYIYIYDMVLRPWYFDHDISIPWWKGIWYIDHGISTINFKLLFIRIKLKIPNVSPVKASSMGTSFLKYSFPLFEIVKIG
jgi:hypothetical protein